MYGYSGKILHIDLTKKTHRIEEKPEEWYKLWIGGVSMATRLCWENITPRCDPYSPENPELRFQLAGNTAWRRNLH
jgi:aldehyde:ferredoxin oxidoreductase